MNPLSIYQQALDIASKAILEGDFATYAAQLDLPYLVHTEVALLLATTAADIRPTFDTMFNGMRARGVTHYERVARHADYVDRDRIEGWHYPHLIADGEPVDYPTVVRHVLVRRGDLWLFSEAHYPVAAEDWPVDEATLFSPLAMPVRNRGAA